MNHAISFVLGVVFAVGLGISGMTSPAKVLAFLDVASGRWDPSLMVVMGSALVVGTIATRFVLARPAPVLDTAWHLPKATGLDAPLIGGAALFGVGWGLTGVCPGPAIVALGTLEAPAVVFFAAMVAGMAVYRLFGRLRAAPEVPVTA